MLDGDVKEPSTGPVIDVANPAAGPPSPGVRRPGGLVSPAGDTPCPACGDVAGDSLAARSFVYAAGQVRFVIPSKAVEKEIAQATGRADTAGLTDRQAIHKLLSQRENRYLARQLCWVLTIQGLETYILVPRDPADLDMLVDAIRPSPRPTDLDVVIGVRGRNAPPQMCNGLMIPIVAFDQIYSFDRDALIKSIPRGDKREKPEKGGTKGFDAAAEELIDRLTQMTDNAGATDEHRALNYLTFRYGRVYEVVTEQFARNASLSAVETRPSALSATRKIVEVVFSYTNRTTDVVEKHFVRVDVTEEFPFLVSKLSPYFDR